MTPFFNGLIHLAQDQLFEQFFLSSDESFVLDLKIKNKSKINKYKRRIRSNSLQLLYLEDEFEQILQQYDFENNSAYQDFDSDEDSDDAEAENVDEEEQQISCQISVTEIKNSEQLQLDRRNAQYTNEFRQKIKKFVTQPRRSIIRQIKAIAQDTKKEMSQSDKIEEIKKFLEQYLIQYQVYCFEEAWKELKLPLKDIIRLLIQGIQETFKKKIGSLPFQDRRVKLLKYLQKKKKRRWRKKVSYDCRKKVADGRLRIKGKFVTRQQAGELLGIKDLDIYTPDEIKELLYKKYEQDRK